MMEGLFANSCTVIGGVLYGRTMLTRLSTSLGLSPGVAVRGNTKVCFMYSGRVSAFCMALRPSICLRLLLGNLNRFCASSMITTHFPGLLISLRGTTRLSCEKLMNVWNPILRWSKLCPTVLHHFRTVIPSSPYGVLSLLRVHSSLGGNGAPAKTTGTISGKKRSMFWAYSEGGLPRMLSLVVTK